jgi:hypothetical protein
MADENNLVIGATIDVDQLKTGLQTSVDEIKNSTANMGIAFTEMSTSAMRATRQITDDTRDAAETISAEWTRAAEASLNFARAQQEVRAATVLAKQSSSEDAEATALLAAAKQKAAAASAELASATKVAVASEEEEAGATVMLGEAFSTLSAGVTGLLTIGLFAHFVSESKDAILQMHDLAVKTGFSIETIAGLRYVADATGTSFESLEQGMGKLVRAQELAAQGGKQYIQALRDINLTVDEVKNLSPEDLFFKVAEAMQSTESPAARAAAAFILFGRGGTALIPIFEEYGATLRKTVETHGELSGATDKSTDSALQYQKTTAELSEQWRSMMVPVMSMVTAGLGFVEKAFIRIDATSKAVMNDLVNGWRDAGELIADVGAALVDVAKGNMQAAKDALSVASTNIGAENERAAARTEEIWKNAADRIREVNLQPKTPDTKSDKGAGGEKVEDTRLQDWKTQLDQMRDAETDFHQLSKAEEAAFWESKLAIARGTPKLYAEVYHQFVEAERQAKQQSLRDEVADVETRVAAERSGSREKITILTEELAHLKSMGAEQTEEYKRLTTQLAAVTRAADAEDMAAAAKKEAVKVSATKDGTLAREKAETDYVAAIKKLYGEDNTQYESALNQQAASHQKFLDNQRKMAEEETGHEATMDELQLQDARNMFAAEEQLGVVSNSQKLAAELNFASQEHEIKLRALNDKLALLAKDPDTNAAELARLHNQVIEEDQRYENQKNQITAAAVNYRKQLEQGLENSLKSGFSSAISGMIMGTQSFAQSFQQIMKGFVSTFSNVLSEMLTQWITTNILMKIFGLEQTTDLNTSKASSDAAVAAGGTFAWWSSVNPLIAPAMAAAAFGEGMVWAGMAGAAGSAAGGALLDEDGPIFAHAGEMIIPSVLSSGLTDLINRGKSGAAESSSTGSSPVNTHFHYHGGDVNALDGQGVGSVLNSHKNEVAKVVKRLVKTGHINPRSFAK